jgi:hypothetical protein
MQPFWRRPELHSAIFPENFILVYSSCIKKYTQGGAGLPLSMKEVTLRTYRFVSLLE